MLKGVLRYTKALCSLAAAGVGACANAAERERLIRFAAREDLRPPWKPSLPTVPLAELGGATNVRLPVENAADGNVSGLELIALATLASRPGIRNIFEIGTFNGMTTLNFALNCADEAKIVTLDLPPENKGDTALQAAGGDLKYIVQERKGWLFRQGRRPEESKITQVFGDSATFDYTPYRDGMDLVFVDGAHSYDYVRKDTEKALTLLRGGHGVIIWHDYCTWWPGVIQYLEEIHRTQELGPVRNIAGTTIVVAFR